jgi:enoyl-CoA hydratase/carnithine racemase
MASIKLDKQESVYLLTMINGDQDNTFNNEVLAEWMDAFDRIEADRENASLLIQSDHAKTFCNGIDLPWLMTQPPEGFKEFIGHLENFFLRLSVLNLPVIAAINGNCYAGGAIAASACDFRFMREDKGRFCFSEIKIKMPFTPAMLAVINLLPNKQALWEMALTSNAYGGYDCMRKQVIDQVFSFENLPFETLRVAEDMATKHRPTYGAIKRGLRPEVMILAEKRGLLRA